MTTLLAGVLVTTPEAGAAVLHDQYAPLGNASGLASNDPAGAGNASEAADDFAVPAGVSWTIDSIDVRSNTTPPPSINVVFYANSGSLPGAVVAARPAMAYSGSATANKVVSVLPAVTLGPGTYWLGVQSANDNGFGWVETTTVRGAVGAWRAEYFGPCTTFHTKGSCGGETAIDQAFRINGTATALPSATTTPKKRGCKRFKSKKKRKKCKKRRRR